MHNESLTGLVIAKNEATDLPGCLDFMTEVCAQVIVVDDSSTDSTVDIAKSYGCKILSTEMDETSGFMGLRNLGLDLVQTEMSLVMDPDERPDNTLVDSIRKAKIGNFYQVYRRNNVFGKWLDYGRFGQDHQVRLFPSITRYEGVVHEIPKLPHGTHVHHLEGTLNHYTYSCLDEYAEKMIRYSTKIADTGIAPTVAETISSVKNNLLNRKAYLDGAVGLSMIAGEVWHDSIARRRAKSVNKN